MAFKENKTHGMGPVARGLRMSSLKIVFSQVLCKIVYAFAESLRIEEGNMSMNRLKGESCGGSGAAMRYLTYTRQEICRRLGGRHA